MVARTAGIHAGMKKLHHWHPMYSQRSYGKPNHIWSSQK